MANSGAAAFKTVSMQCALAGNGAAGRRGDIRALAAPLIERLTANVTRCCSRGSLARRIVHGNAFSRMSVPFLMVRRMRFRSKDDALLVRRKP